jgi:hypothetical protein
VVERDYHELGLNQAKEESAIKQEKLQRYSGMKYQMLLNQAKKTLL